MKISNFFLSVIFVASGYWNVCFAADIRDSVVKVYTTTNRVDFYHPWQTKGSTSLIGSGGIISGNRILTNAHVVSDQTFIQVKKYSDPKKYTAKLVAIGHDCDLAILAVEDENFFKDVPALDIGELPSLRDVVNVIGFSGSPIAEEVIVELLLLESKAVASPRRVSKPSTWMADWRSGS